ncbi:MAG: hypothetical protein WCJ84_01360 [Candidatus Peregrinibacteria bacterium]
MTTFLFFMRESLFRSAVLEVCTEIPQVSDPCITELKTNIHTLVEAINNKTDEEGIQTIIKNTKGSVRTLANIFAKVLKNQTLFLVLPLKINTEFEHFLRDITGPLSTHVDRLITAQEDEEDEEDTKEIENNIHGVLRDLGEFLTLCDGFRQNNDTITEDGVYDSFENLTKASGNSRMNLDEVI